jgi:flagellar operon protein
MLKVNAYRNAAMPVQVTGPKPVPKQPQGQKTQSAQKVDFKSALDEVIGKSQKVSFSAHARARLFSRGVQLTDAKLEELSKAIDKAESKGSRESLVLTGDAAYVVAVKNRTVITAFDPNNLRDGVVTSIDSAVIV